MMCSEIWTGNCPNPSRKMTLGNNVKEGPIIFRRGYMDISDPFGPFYFNKSNNTLYIVDDFEPGLNHKEPIHLIYYSTDKYDPESKTYSSVM